MRLRYRERRGPRCWRALERELPDARVGRDRRRTVRAGAPARRSTSGRSPPRASARWCSAGVGSRSGSRTCPSGDRRRRARARRRRVSLGRGSWPARSCVHRHRRVAGDRPRDRADARVEGAALLLVGRRRDALEAVGRECAGRVRSGGDRHHRARRGRADRRRLHRRVRTDRRARQQRRHEPCGGARAADRRGLAVAVGAERARADAADACVRAGDGRRPVGAGSSTSARRRASARASGTSPTR